MGMVYNMIGIQLASYIGNAIGTQWDCDTWCWYPIGLGHMVLVHNGIVTYGTGTQCEWDTWYWYTMGLRHNGYGIQWWDWDTMIERHGAGIGTYGAGTQWDWDIKVLVHCVSGT